MQRIGFRPFHSLLTQWITPLIFSPRSLSSSSQLPGSDLFHLLISLSLRLVFSDLYSVITLFNKLKFIATDNLLTFNFYNLQNVFLDQYKLSSIRPVILWACIFEQHKLFLNNTTGCYDSNQTNKIFCYIIEKRFY